MGAVNNININLDNLKRAREKAEISQKEVADFLGVCKETYRKKENGKSEFSLKEAKKIANLFDTKIEKIFFSRYFGMIEPQKVRLTINNVRVKL